MLQQSSEPQLLTRQEVEAIYRLMRAQKFPEPLRIGQRAVRWPASEIEAWIESRPRATGDQPAV